MPEGFNGVQFYPGTQIKSFYYKALPHGEGLSDGRFHVSSSIDFTINRTFAFDYNGGYKSNSTQYPLYQRPAL